MKISAISLALAAISLAAGWGLAQAPLAPTPPPGVPAPPPGVEIGNFGITAGREAITAGRAPLIRGGMIAPRPPGVTAGMAHIGGGPGLSGLAPGYTARTPIGGIPGTVTARDVGTWAGPNGIGRTLGDVSARLEAIGTPPGLVEQGRPGLRPGIAYGGSRAGTEGAWVVGGVGLAAGVPQPNFVGRGIQPNIQPWANTRVGAGLASEYGVYGGRVIQSGGDVGAGYGTNLRARWFLNDYGTPVATSPFGNVIR